MRYNYDLFCQRKSFLIKNYFATYPNASYEDFCLFLTQRSVIPPNKEYFESEKEKLSPKKEPAAVVAEENTSEPIEENTSGPIEEVKKPRRRRTTKPKKEKTQTENAEVKKTRRRRRSAKKNDS